jgi:hypothetical protein
LRVYLGDDGCGLRPRFFPFSLFLSLFLSGRESSLIPP